eukprot:jgi/Botrbrau1/12873/Bobra.0188s0015.1
MASALQSQLTAQAGLGLCRVRQRSISVCSATQFDFGIRYCRPAIAGIPGSKSQLRTRRHRQCRISAMFGEDDELKEGIEQGTRVKVIKSVKVRRSGDASGYPVGTLYGAARNVLVWDLEEST